MVGSYVHYHDCVEVTEVGQADDCRVGYASTVSVRQMHMVASCTPQQQQYNQKDKVVQPTQIVIKLRKARIILYTGLRKFWLIQIIF
jgi:hypothetical protein